PSSPPNGTTSARSRARRCTSRRSTSSTSPPTRPSCSRTRRTACGLRRRPASSSSPSQTRSPATTGWTRRIWSSRRSPTCRRTSCSPASAEEPNECRHGCAGDDDEPERSTERDGDRSRGETGDARVEHERAAARERLGYDECSEDPRCDHLEQLVHTGRKEATGDGDRPDGLPHDG